MRSAHPAPQFTRVLALRAPEVGLLAAPLAPCPLQSPVSLRALGPPRAPRGPSRPAAAQTVRRQGRDVTHS